MRIATHAWTPCLKDLHRISELHASYLNVHAIRMNARAQDLAIRDRGCSPLLPVRGRMLCRRKRCGMGVLTAAACPRPDAVQMRGRHGQALAGVSERIRGRGREPGRAPQSACLAQQGCTEPKLQRRIGTDECLGGCVWAPRALDALALACGSYAPMHQVLVVHWRLLPPSIVVVHWCCCLQALLLWCIGGCLQALLWCIALASWAHKHFMHWCS